MDHQHPTIVRIGPCALSAPLHALDTVYLKIHTPDGWYYQGGLTTGTIGEVEDWCREHGLELRAHLPAAVDSFLRNHGPISRLPQDLIAIVDQERAVPLMQAAE